MVERTQSNHQLENWKNLHPMTDHEPEVDHSYQEDGRNTEQAIAQKADTTNPDTRITGSQRAPKPNSVPNYGKRND